MKMIIGMETSGLLREAMRAKGHDAWSCDLLPSEDGSPFHIQGDVFNVIGEAWDFGFFHPTCTYVCGSGLHWNKRVPGRAEKTEQAVADVLRLEKETRHIPRRGFENPIGCLSTRWMKPTQIVQPNWFGDDASKATCFWLFGLPPLVPTKKIPGRIVGYRKNGKPIERWANQTDSGQNRLGPSEDRWKERSRSYPGIVQAQAELWGCLPANGVFSGATSGASAGKQG